MKHPSILCTMADELSGGQRGTVQIVLDILLRHWVFDFETSYWASLVTKRYRMAVTNPSYQCSM